MFHNELFELVAFVNLFYSSIKLVSDWSSIILSALSQSDKGLRTCLNWMASLK